MHQKLWLIYLAALSVDIAAIFLIIHFRGK